MKTNNNKIINIIWVIDDEKIIRESLKSALRLYNYKTKAFAAAEEALKYINSNCEGMPELIISDFQLLKMSGLELLKIIKKKYKDIKVIIMTGFSDKKLMTEIVNHGADDFIEKPFTPKQLAAIIEKIADKHKIQNGN